MRRWLRRAWPLLATLAGSDGLLYTAGMEDGEATVWSSSDAGATRDLEATGAPT
jgi:hypothetical protein